MNLRDLEYVVAVAEHGGFGRAAAACNVSQPTLSGQILKLEAELGLKLFERSGRAVRLEPRAQAVIAEARAALTAAANVAAAARAARDPFAGPLRVGMIATVAPYLLPLALPAAMKALPETPLHLIEDLTDRLIALMGEGSIDAAVIASDPGKGGFASVPLYDEPFYWVAARTRRGARRKTIGVDEIDGKRLLLLAEGHCLRDQALALCGAAKGPSGADVRAMSLETIRHLAAAGRGRARRSPRCWLSRPGGGRTRSCKAYGSLGAARRGLSGLPARAIAPAGRRSKRSPPRCAARPSGRSRRIRRGKRLWRQAKNNT